MLFVSTILRVWNSYFSTQGEWKPREFDYNSITNTPRRYHRHTGQYLASQIKAKDWKETLRQSNYHAVLVLVIIGMYTRHETIYRKMLKKWVIPMHKYTYLYIFLLCTRIEGCETLV